MANTGGSYRLVDGKKVLIEATDVVAPPEPPTTPDLPGTDNDTETGEVTDHAVS